MGGGGGRGGACVEVGSDGGQQPSQLLIKVAPVIEVHVAPVRGPVLADEQVLLGRFLQSLATVLVEEWCAPYYAVMYCIVLYCTVSVP